MVDILHVPRLASGKHYPISFDGDQLTRGYRNSGLWCMQDYVIIMSLFLLYCTCAK